jgi:class 3 adenylate cyclase/CHASE2 domain-containing sensor protein
LTPSATRPRADRWRAWGLAAWVLICVALPLTQWAGPLELKLLDAQFSALARWREPLPGEDIVIVAVDEPTLAAIAEPLPLAHVHLGELFTALAAAGAKAVALDLILPERSYDGLVPGNDQQLILGILAMRRAGIVVLARTVDEGGRPRMIHAPLLAAAGPQGSGLALMPVDSDGVVRRFDEHLGQDGSAVDTLVGTLARRLGETPQSGLIDFSRYAGFKTLPLIDVLGQIQAGDGSALVQEFRGKLVFVGTTLPFLDRHRVPPVPAVLALHDDTQVPGVEIHAQALSSILAHGLIQPVALVWVMLAGALCALAWWWGSSMLRAAVAALAAVVLLGATSTGLLALGHELPVAGLMLCAALAAASRLGFETLVEIRARRRLRRSFAGYVSPAVLAELESGQLEGMASARRFVCVMFLDVRGFTTRSEHDPPESVTAVLNALFEMATEVIHRHGGTVKEFMGDGVMSFFGAPQVLDDPVRACFAAAQELLAQVPTVNRNLEGLSQPPLAIGIGMACGEAVVGHIGAAARHAYGAVGDCVNLASRLEGLSKELDHPLILSGEVRRRLGDDPRLTCLGVRRIKGHSDVGVFGWR